MSYAAMRIIGIDCATADNKVGIALGHLEGSVPVVSRMLLCGKSPRTAAQTLCELLGNREPSLLALDAPLGWPSSLGPALAQHVAGAGIQIESNRLFRRVTDRFIKDEIDQQPLDVGSDRIARTALWAVNLLSELRSVCRDDIPLAWDPTGVQQTAAIEVYPAATLKSIGIPKDAYKKRGDHPGRERLIAALHSHVRLPDDREVMRESADVIDAVVCLIAGADFLRGQAISPTDLAAAKREGWIWVRRPIGKKN